MSQTVNLFVKTLDRNRGTRRGCEHFWLSLDDRMSSLLEKMRASSSYSTAGMTSFAQNEPGFALCNKPGVNLQYQPAFWRAHCTQVGFWFRAADANIRNPVMTQVVPFELIERWRAGEFSGTAGLAGAPAILLNAGTARAGHGRAVGSALAYAEHAQDDDSDRVLAELASVVLLNNPEFAAQQLAAEMAAHVSTHTPALLSQPASSSAPQGAASPHSPHRRRMGV
jgi:hypothetical protein